MGMFSNEGNCEFIFSGPGVERISEEVKKNFPSKQIEIFSSDTMNKKSSIEKLDKIIGFFQGLCHLYECDLYISYTLKYNLNYRY